MNVFDGLGLVTRPEVYLPALGFLGLALLSSWALFRATDRRKRYDDEWIEADQSHGSRDDHPRLEQWRTAQDWLQDQEVDKRDEQPADLEQQPRIGDLSRLGAPPEERSTHDRRRSGHETRDVEREVRVGNRYVTGERLDDDVDGQEEQQT